MNSDALNKDRLKFRIWMPFPDFTGGHLFLKRDFCYRKVPGRNLKDIFMIKKKSGNPLNKNTGAQGEAPVFKQSERKTLRIFTLSDFFE